MAAFFLERTPMSIDSYLRRLQMRATAAEPTLPKILAVKKPAMVPEDEDVADEEGDDSAGDEDISFDDFMDEAGIDANEDEEDDAAPDSEDGDTEAEPDMDVDSLTHAEEPVPKKPLPKPGKPGKAKPAVPAKQPAPVAQVAPTHQAMILTVSTLINPPKKVIIEYDTIGHLTTPQKALIRAKGSIGVARAKNNHHESASLSSIFFSAASICFQLTPKYFPNLFINGLPR
jgi:hypothetical protein